MEEATLHETVSDVVTINSIHHKNANFIWATFGNRAVKSICLIDTGAQVSIIPKKLFDTLPPADLRAANIDIRAGNGSKIPCHGIATVSIAFQGLQFEHPMYVVSDVKHVIIGYDFLNATKDAHISPSHNSVRICGQDIALVDTDDPTVQQALQA